MWEDEIQLRTRVEETVGRSLPTLLCIGDRDIKTFSAEAQAAFPIEQGDVLEYWATADDINFVYSVAVCGDFVFVIDSNGRVLR